MMKGVEWGCGVVLLGSDDYVRTLLQSKAAVPKRSMCTPCWLVSKNTVSGFAQTGLLNQFCDKSAAWNCFIFYQTNESSRFMQIESNESQSGYTEDLEVLCQRIVTPFTLDTEIMDLVSRKH